MPYFPRTIRAHLPVVKSCYNCCCSLLLHSYPQEPVSALESRLRGLLASYPDHPLLTQLRSIALRLLAMPLTAPLKTALTGLELLFSRAQVWEETAAQFVSLKAQLGPVAALATRWRRLELSSWKGLLRRVAARHAAGAHRSWFHLHRLLAPTALLPAEDGIVSGGAGSGGAAAAASAEDAAAALAASGVPLLLGLEGVSAMINAGAADGGGAAAATLPAEQEQTYRRVASTLEAFVQTSTLGEFRARLAMLRAFEAHVRVRQQQPGGAGPLAAPLAAALSNVVRYYGQFAGAVDAALTEGMAPLEKDLQVGQGQRNESTSRLTMLPLGQGAGGSELDNGPLRLKLGCY